MFIVKRMPPCGLLFISWTEGKVEERRRKEMEGEIK